MRDVVRVWEGVVLREGCRSHRVGWSASMVAIEVVGFRRTFGRGRVGKVGVWVGDSSGIGGYGLEIGGGISRDFGAVRVPIVVLYGGDSGGRCEGVVVKFVIVMLLVVAVAMVVVMVVVLLTGIMLLLVMEGSRAGRQWCGAQAVLLVAPVHGVAVISQASKTQPSQGGRTCQHQTGRIIIRAGGSDDVRRTCSSAVREADGWTKWRVESLRSLQRFCRV